MANSDTAGLARARGKETNPGNKQGRSSKAGKELKMGHSPRQAPTNGGAIVKSTNGLGPAGR